MANLFNRKPGRYQRRKKAVPILIALGAAAVLALAVLAGTAIVKRLTGEKTPNTVDVAQPAEAQQPADETPTAPAPEETPSAPVEETPEYDPETAYLTEWRQFIMGGGALVGYFDEETMDLSADTTTGLTSIVLSEESGARVDVQSVSGSFELLTEDEMQRVAVGILQAYYYAAPATADISCTDAVLTDRDYTVQLSAPATAEAPAATATVRLMKADGRLWYAAALCPEGSECGELPLVVSRIEIGG